MEMCIIFFTMKRGVSVMRLLRWKAPASDSIEAFNINFLQWISPGFGQ